MSGGKPPRKRHKAELNAIANQALGEIHAYLDTLSDRQLMAAQKAVEGLNQTNCGWPVYRMKDLILSAIRDNRFARRRAKKNGEPFNGVSALYRES